MAKADLESKKKARVKEANEALKNVSDDITKLTRKGEGDLKVHDLLGIIDKQQNAMQVYFDKNLDNVTDELESIGEQLGELRDLGDDVKTLRKDMTEVIKLLKGEGDEKGLVSSVAEIRQKTVTEEDLENRLKQGGIVMGPQEPGMSPAAKNWMVIGVSFLGGVVAGAGGTWFKNRNNNKEEGGNGQEGGAPQVTVMRARGRGAR